MTEDDPRHGTTAGHNAGCRCVPCSTAKLAYDKRRRLDEATGRPRTLPGWRVSRRLEALQALGWSLRRFADEAGLKHNDLSSYGRRRLRVTVDTFAKIDAAYQRLCMSHPPQRNRWERQGVSRTKAHAARQGYAPPLAYDDIDSDLEPSGMRKDWGADYDNNGLVDENTVERILAGEVLRTNRAEKEEVMRRWLAAGGSERSLCVRMGWKDGRYKPSQETAA